MWLSGHRTKVYKIFKQERKPCIGWPDSKTSQVETALEAGRKI